MKGKQNSWENVCFYERPNMKYKAVILGFVLFPLLYPPSAAAESYHRRNWSSGYNDYRAGINRDYTIKNTTRDAEGRPTTTRTEVEQDHDEYNRKTTVRGPDGEYSAQEIEIDYGDDKIKQKTTTTHPDGTVDVDTQRYKVND